MPRAAGVAEIEFVLRLVQRETAEDCQRIAIQVAEQWNTPSSRLIGEQISAAVAKLHGAK